MEEGIGLPNVAMGPVDALVVGKKLIWGLVMYVVELDGVGLMRMYWLTVMPYAGCAT